jgi:probable blue pigment (indigoidine) exporter
LNKSNFLIAGILFAALWASASAAAKIGLQSVEPLVLFNIRFIIAGVLMLFYAYVFQKNPLPTNKEWKELSIFGLFNTTLYLGFFILAMKQVSAGIGSLSTATNPLIISILSAIWIGKKVKNNVIIGIVLGMIGVGFATYPLLKDAHASIEGLLILLLSMLCYSIGTIYYSKVEWKLSRLVVNGWQVLIGGILILPFTFFMHQKDNNFDARFWFSELWLIVPVSVISVQLWLYLLKIDAVKASLWLFLCPIFGFTYAYFLLNEPITIFTFLGTSLVIFGLYFGQKNKVV